MRGMGVTPVAVDVSSETPPLPREWVTPDPFGFAEGGIFFKSFIPPFFIPIFFGPLGPPPPPRPLGGWVGLGQIHPPLPPGVSQSNLPPAARRPLPADRWGASDHFAVFVHAVLDEVLANLTLGVLFRSVPSCRPGPPTCSEEGGVCLNDRTNRRRIR